MNKQQKFARAYLTEHARKLTETEKRIRNGESFTDDEGNYWGFIYNNEGKRVRVCIPAK